MPKLTELIVYRGLSTSLSGLTLSEGELVYASDEDLLYIADQAGTARPAGRVLSGAGDPVTAGYAAGRQGRMYHDTVSDDLYVDNGSTWDKVGITDLADMNGDLDDISDGVTYGKVAVTELQGGAGGDGTVFRLNDGTNTLTAAQGVAKADKIIPGAAGNLAALDATGNLADSSLTKNDGGTGTTDLWSGNQISNAIDNAISGLNWKDAVSVLNLISDADMSGADPVAPTKGDAYVVNNWSTQTDGDIVEYSGSAWVVVVANSGGAVPTGARAIVTGLDGSGAAGSFAGEDKNLAEFNGSSWDFETAAQGDAVLVAATNSVYDKNGYNYNNSAWRLFTGAGSINAGVGLELDGNTMNVLLGAGIKELPNDEVGVDVSSGGGLELTSELTGGQLQIKGDTSAAATIVPISTSATGAGITTDNVTLFNNAGTLEIKDGGVDAADLAAAVAGDGLTGGAGSPLAVGGGNGIGVSADAISITPDSSGGNIQPLNVVAAGAGVDIAAIAGTGIEADGSANLQLATQGNGLAGGGGSLLSVKRDTVTGATVAAVNVNSDGVGVLLDNATIVHASNTIQVADGGIGATQLAAAVAGAGLTGGAGSALDVGAGDGISVAADAVAVKADDSASATIAPVNVDANGVGVEIDNDTLVHTSGVLKVVKVDGGTF